VVLVLLVRLPEPVALGLVVAQVVADAVGWGTLLETAVLPMICPLEE